MGNLGKSTNYLRASVTINPNIKRNYVFAVVGRGGWGYKIATFLANTIFKLVCGWWERCQSVDLFCDHLTTALENRGVKKHLGGPKTIN